MPDFDSLDNHGEFFATHYYAEQLDEELRKGLFKTWTDREDDEHETAARRATPRKQLRILRGMYYSDKARTYFAERADKGDSAFTYGSPEWRSRIASWHRQVLTALGFETPRAEGSEEGDGEPEESKEPTFVELTVHQAGKDHQVRAAYSGNGVVALDCGWANGFDGLLAPDGPAHLLEPLRVSGSERYEDGSAVASYLLHAEEVNGSEPPRFVLLLLGGVIVLVDKRSFGEGRYLAANLDAAFPRDHQKQSKTGELPTIAALFCREQLEPRENGEGPLLDGLLDGSTKNAVGVTNELRDGLREAVEFIANEVLARLRDAGVDPIELAKSRLGLSDAREFAKLLSRESLRYLYRILFLLYAEARPELGILPADDDAYEQGYSIARLRELVEREQRILDEQSRRGFHLYESLDLLFHMVNEGHREFGSEAGDEDLDPAKRSDDLGLRFEPLHADLFGLDAVTLIGRRLLPPDVDEDSLDESELASLRLDTRLRNETLHRVLRKLTLTTGRKGPRGKRERGGFISYRNLGISQLGAVYEGLMSYTGSIATEELYEIAKGGNAEGGSWVVPASRISEYPDEVFVTYSKDDGEGRSGRKRYKKDEFVYRLSGRDRQTSASYYTPDSLTSLTVELALRELATEGTTAAQILQYKICEPALGSGAFLNEAINQVAQLYLTRRQDELGRAIDGSKRLEELQKAKAYIALHNSYGVDLNATAVELAEISLWLNTMHPGMRAPWYGLHLRRGNSLIGGRRVVYAAEDVVEGQWAKKTKTLPPTELSFRQDGAWQPLPEGAVHQFLLPAVGWAAIAGEKDAKTLEPTLAKQLADWRTGIVKVPSAKAPRSSKAGSQLERLQGLARRAEFLWELVVKRIELSERQIARKIDVWGTRPEGDEDPDLFGFIQQPEHPVSKETVYGDLFDNPGSPYWRLSKLMDTWCALWFWPLDNAGLLDGTDDRYPPADAGVQAADPEGSRTTLPPPPATEPLDFRFVEQGVLFGDFQGTLMSAEDSGEYLAKTVKTGGGTRRTGTRKATIVRRATIPLKTLDDWIDFAECLLGQIDMPEDSLVSDFPELDALSEFEEQLPAVMGMDSPFNLGERFPWLNTVEEIAKDQGFFHWELAFAYTFAVNGGFDLQVGNPPWVRPVWTEDLVLAEFEPWFGLTEKKNQAEKNRRRALLLGTPASYSYWHAELLKTTVYSDYFSSPLTYALLAGQPDLYRCFMLHTWASSSARGSIGLLHPDTHFTGEKEGALRGMAYRRLRIHGDFFNPGHRFFPKPIGESSHFGVHVYGSAGEIRFDHLSWLLSANTMRNSWAHGGEGEPPGVRYQGKLDERPHRLRVVRVDDSTLGLWQKLSGDVDVPVGQARLLTPVSTAEDPAIRALADYPFRLSQLKPQITRGFDESGAKKRGLIRHDLSDPDNWAEVVLKGLQIGLANPFFKEPDAGSNDPPINLYELAADAVSRTEYRPNGDRAVFEADKDRWIDYKRLAELRLDSIEIATALAELGDSTSKAGSPVTEREIEAHLINKARRPYTDFYRMAWRERVADDTERALYTAIIPPEVSHINSVRSAVGKDNRTTVLAGVFWSGLPVDYFLRTAATGHLHEGPSQRLPAPQPSHPFAESLLLRGMRLNCLTSAYADLWSELHQPLWQDEQWAVAWPGAEPLGDVNEQWAMGTGLRNELARRAASIEIDAMVAVWLGIDADTLVTMYRARFPVLGRFEDASWFDAKGWKIASNARTYGEHQAKDSWKQLEKHLKDSEKEPPPEGYTPPFYKVDREGEMRAAHAVFQKRLDEAVARGEWDPIKQEVPGQ